MDIPNEIYWEEVKLLGNKNDWRVEFQGYILKTGTYAQCKDFVDNRGVEPLKQIISDAKNYLLPMLY